MRKALLLLLFVLVFLVMSYVVMLLSVSTLVLYWAAIFNLLGG